MYWETYSGQCTADAIPWVPRCQLIPAQNRRECLAAEMQPERANPTKSSGTPDCWAAIEKAVATVASHAQEKLLCRRMSVALVENIGNPGRIHREHDKCSSRAYQRQQPHAACAPSPKSAINPCTGEPSNCSCSGVKK